MKKKILLISLALLLAISLVAIGCPTPPPEEAPPTPAEEVGPPIKIGALGPHEIMGPGFYNGAFLAAEEVNEAGGVLVGKVRRPIEVIKVETNELTSVTDAVAAAERAITVDKVDFLTGAMRTEAVLAMQDVAMDHKTIFISTIANHPELCARVATDYDRYKYFFRCWLPNAIHTTFMINALTETVADTVRKELGVETPKVAIIAEKVAWADVVVEGSKETLTKMGMEVVGVWRPSGFATDVSAELSAIKASGAQIMQITTTGPVGFVLTSTWGEAKIPVAPVGWNVDIMRLDAWERTGGKAAYEATWTGLTRTKVTDKSIPYYDKFVERFGPELMSSTYDVVYILKDAIEKVGTLDADALVVELEKTDYEGAFGRVVFTGRETPFPHDLTFGPGYATGVGAQWVDGKLVCIWPHGRAVLGDERWAGLRYEGTVDYVLPPHVKEYWKAK